METKTEFQIYNDLSMNPQHKWTLRDYKTKWVRVDDMKKWIMNYFDDEPDEYCYIIDELEKELSRSSKEGRDK